MWVYFTTQLFRFLDLRTCGIAHTIENNECPFKTLRNMLNETTTLSPFEYLTFFVMYH